MSSPTDSLYPRIVYVRVSESEKAKIAERARACGLSESRLLARLGTGAPPPPTLDEREDLRVVRLMLSQLVSTLGALTNRPEFVKAEEHPSTSEEILSAVKTAKALLRSLGRRLRL